MRREWCAHPLAEPHHDLVDRNPPWPRHQLHQSLLRLIRRSRTNPAQPVRNPVHVCIDADGRRSVAQRNHQRRRFTSHPFEVQQCVDRARDFAGKFLLDPTRHVAQRPRFRPIESRRIDRLLDARNVQKSQLSRCGCDGEQTRRRRLGDVVFGTKTQDRGNQNPKRIPVAARDLRDRRQLLTRHRALHRGQCRSDPRTRYRFGTR